MERQKEQERKRCEKVKEMWEGAKWSGNKEIKRSEGNGAERREALGAKGTIKHDPKGAKNKLQFHYFLECWREKRGFQNMVSFFSHG